MKTDLILPAILGALIPQVTAGCYDSPGDVQVHPEIARGYYTNACNSAQFGGVIQPQGTRRVCVQLNQNYKLDLRLQNKNGGRGFDFEQQRLCQGV